MCRKRTTDDPKRWPPSPPDGAQRFFTAVWLRLSLRRVIRYPGNHRFRRCRVGLRAHGSRQSSDALIQLRSGRNTSVFCCTPLPTYP